MDTIVRPFISIIIPCYNSERTINNTIDSVIAQAINSWEMIIVNDGSTDKTTNIIMEYARKDARIKVLSKENGGYTSAVNYGLEFITGEYFILLGSDDTLGSNLFSSILQYCTNNMHPDIIGFRTVIDKNGIKIRDANTEFEDILTENTTTINEFSNLYPSYARIFLQEIHPRLIKRVF